MTHLDHLIKKHQELDYQITLMQSRKLLNNEDLARLHYLKKRKLALKDQIQSVKARQNQ